MIIQLHHPRDDIPIRTSPSIAHPPPHTVWIIGYRHGPTCYSAFALSDTGQPITMLDSTDPGFLVMDITLMGKLDTVLSEEYPDGWQIHFATVEKAEQLLAMHREKQQ